MSSEINNFVKFSFKLADTARQISLFYFKKKLKVINKNKNKFDPVTIADIKIQKELNKAILKTFPDHSIFGDCYQCHLEEYLCISEIPLKFFPMRKFAFDLLQPQ